MHWGIPPLKTPPSFLERGKGGCTLRGLNKVNKAILKWDSNLLLHARLSQSFNPGQIYETNFSVVREIFNFIQFKQFFASIDKIFVLGVTLGTRL